VPLPLASCLKSLAYCLVPFICCLLPVADFLLPAPYSRSLLPEKILPERNRHPHLTNQSRRVQGSERPAAPPRTVLSQPPTRGPTQPLTCCTDATVSSIVGTVDKSAIANRSLLEAWGTLYHHSWVKDSWDKEQPQTDKTQGWNEGRWTTSRVGMNEGLE
jgi:hypothetical protein